MPALRAASSPNTGLAGALPALVLRAVGLLDAVALDLEGRRNEAALDRPRLADDDQAVHLLVRVELGVDLAQVRLERALHGFAGTLQAFGRQHHQPQRLPEVGTGDAASFHRRVHDQFVLDRRRRDVFALAGLEQVLHTAGDAQVALGVELALVAGVQVAVVGEGLLRELGLLVVAEHRAFALDLDLAVARVDARVHRVVRQAHRAWALRALQGGV